MENRHIRNTWIGWGLYILFICILITATDFKRSVTPDYIYGALQWLGGKQMYNNAGSGFIYFPQSAIFYIPFAKLPFALSEILWRIVSFSLFGYAIYRFAKLHGKQTLSITFPIITLISLLIGFSTARNGQFNIIVVDCMLLAAITLSQKQWWAAACFLVLGIALKPTMIVMLLLCFALYRPLWWRVPVLLVVAFVLPFLTQSPHYVMSEYHTMLIMLTQVAHVGMSQKDWAQVFAMLSQFGITLPGLGQTLIRLVFALLTLGLAFYYKGHVSGERFVIILFTLAATYLMLFNPRTENNDYIILAPAIGSLLAITIIQGRHLLAVVLGMISFGLIASYNLSILLIPGQTAWFAPLMGLLFMIIYLIHLVSDNGWQEQRKTG